MQGLSETQRSALERTCLTLGGCGAGSLCTLAIAHGPSASVAIAVGVGAALASAVASLSAALPAIIAALGAREVARSKANAEAQVALEGARQRSTLVNAGLEGRLDAALSLLKLQPLGTQVLVDPRFGDDMLRALLPEPRASCETDSGLAVIRSRKRGARRPPRG
ncbi:MAG: hypothetical protein ACRDOI_22785 [Trebonia sp.]